MSDSVNLAEQVLAQLLERAVAGVDAAVEFSKAEIPDVVRQLLMWHFAESLIFFVVGLVIVAVTAYGVWRVIRIRPEALRQEENRYGDPRTIYKSTLWFDRDGDSTGAHILLVIAVFPIGIGIACMNVQWLKIWIAPKLYLLEYGASLYQ